VCARETESEKREEYMCASCECLVKGWCAVIALSVSRANMKLEQNVCAFVCVSSKFEGKKKLR